MMVAQQVWVEIVTQFDSKIVRKCGNCSRADDE
jgi:hypothetical protein